MHEIRHKHVAFTLSRRARWQSSRINFSLVSRDLMCPPSNRRRAFLWQLDELRGAREACAHLGATMCLCSDKRKHFNLFSFEARRKSAIRRRSRGTEAVIAPRSRICVHASTLGGGTASPIHTHALTLALSHSDTAAIGVTRSIRVCG